MAEHSPLPWAAAKSRGLKSWAIVSFGGTDVADVWDVDVTSGVAAANAKYIVRCVNSHDGLVEALKECSFRLAACVAAHADFSDANAKALDLASAAPRANGGD